MGEGREVGDMTARGGVGQGGVGRSQTGKGRWRIAQLCHRAPNPC